MDVAVLEPREVLRCGLASMLERINVVSNLECHDDIGDLLGARKARGKARGNEGCPVVVIVSSALNQDVVDVVRDTFPSSRVLKLVASADLRDLAAATKTQADGYMMLQEATEATLDRALQALTRGEPAIPQPIADYLFERARSTDVSPPWARSYFNPSERIVIDLLLDGLSNREIAQRLGISLHSAKRRVSAVLHKANSPSRAHFVAQMLRGTTASTKSRDDLLH